MENELYPINTGVDTTSIVHLNMNFGNGKCNNGRPDVFVVLNAGDEGKVALECGRITINNCSQNVILLDKVKRQEVGNHVSVICCEDASKTKYRIECKEGDGCSSTVMQVNLKKFEACDSEPLLLSISKDYKCEPLTCTQKVAAFVDFANSQQTSAVFSIDPSEDTAIYIEWATEGVFFTVEVAQGFYPAELVTFGLPSIGKGFALRDYFSDLACLPQLCGADKCYTIYAFHYGYDLPFGGHGLFSSTTGINNNNSYVTQYKLVWIAVESTATAVITVLEDAFNSGSYPLICNTACTPQIANKTLCIARTDAGNAAALATIIADYPSATSITRDRKKAGVSYYNATFPSALVVVPILADVVSDTPCGEDELN